MTIKSQVYSPDFVCRVTYISAGLSCIMYGLWYKRGQIILILHIPAIRLLEMDDGQYQYLYNCLRVWYWSWYCRVQVKSVSTVLKFSSGAWKVNICIIVTIFVFAKVALFYTYRKHSFPTVLFRTIYIHYADTNQQLHYLLFYLVVLTKETDAVAAVLLFIHIVHAQFSFLSNIFLAFPDELQRQPQFCPLGTHSLCTYLFDSGIGRSKVNTFYVLPMSWAR